MIPGGPAGAQRALHDELELEPRAVSDKGSVLVMGEVVNTAVRKLLAAGLITDEDAFCAQLFKFDHDTAYASCINPLARLQVDCSGDGSGGLINRIFSAGRFEEARRHLRSRMFRIAQAAILESQGPNVEGSYTALGAAKLVNADARDQRAGGKMALIMVIEELTEFYRSKNAMRAA